MTVQKWVTGLGDRLVPAIVWKCFRVFRAVLRAAVRARRITVDPTEGVSAPSTYRPRPLTGIISRADFRSKLLPAIPREHRALVCVAAGASLRWGECTGLPWGAVDMNSGRLYVRQVAVETAGAVTLKPYPKTRAGFRVVPIPGFLAAALHERRALTAPDGDPAPTALVFGTTTGTATEAVQLPAPGLATGPRASRSAGPG